MKCQAGNNPAELESSFHPKNILAKQRASTQYVVPLTGPTDEIHEYGELVNILTHSGEEDKVYIQLPSPDGSLEACDYLFRRMEECVAHSIVELGRTCTSTASAVALQVGAWATYDRSIMMVHSCHLSHAYVKESDQKTVSLSRAGITLPISAKFGSSCEKSEYKRIAK